MKRILPLLLLVLSASAAFGGHAGIWKSTNPSNNFYLQTYKSDNSILVIVTPDAVSEWYVFHDTNIADGIDVAELTGKPARLILYLNAETDIVADLNVSGHSTIYDLKRVSEADSRVVGGNNPVTPPTPPNVDHRGTYELAFSVTRCSNGAVLTNDDVNGSGTFTCDGKNSTQTTIVDGWTKVETKSYSIRWVSANEATVTFDDGSRETWTVQGFTAVLTYEMQVNGLTCEGWDSWSKVSDVY